MFEQPFQGCTAVGSGTNKAWCAGPFRFEFPTLSWGFTQFWPNRSTLSTLSTSGLPALSDQLSPSAVIGLSSSSVLVLRKLQFFGIQRREENHPDILLEYVYHINMCVCHLCIYIYVYIYIMSTTCIQSCGQFLFVESASYLWMPSPLEQITTLDASIFRWEKIHGDLWRRIIPNVLQIGG
jgi:hypothetical protein